MPQLCHTRSDMKRLFLPAVLAVIAAVIGMFLPRGYNVRAEKNISASDTVVFDMINELQQSRNWYR